MLSRRQLLTYLIAVALGLGFANSALADVIIFGGTITQSTQDGTGPAQNNLSLNNIQDLQAYTAIVPIGNPIHGQNRLAEPDTNHQLGPLVPCSVEMQFATAVGELK